MLDQNQIRPWQTELNRESPSIKPYIAHHKLGEYELFYLAAHHSNDPSSETLRLIDLLFREFEFRFLLIEPIPHKEGENPNWFLDEAKSRMGEPVIRGGESSLGVVRAAEKDVSFAGAEVDHKELFLQLRNQGFSIEDVVGFYLVRQIPQWVREKEEKKTLIARRGPLYIQHYCKAFGVDLKCPSMESIEKWYEKASGKKLSSDVDPDEVAPVFGSTQLTQKISSAVGIIRDRYTIQIIQQYLQKFKKVAVVYGASHYLTLRNGIEAGLGKPIAIVTVENAGSKK